MSCDDEDNMQGLCATVCEWHHYLFLVLKIFVAKIRDMVQISVGFGIV